MVIGGGDALKTSILFLDSDRWITGPDSPLNLRHGTSVQYENTFIIVGGLNWDGRPLKTIWKYDVDKENWIRMPQNLILGRSKPTAFFVSHTFCK